MSLLATVDLLGAPTSADIADLAALLVEAVELGASVGFLDGFSQSEAVAWWTLFLSGPGVTTWVARDGARRIVGTASLEHASAPNSVHRAEVKKVLVRRDFRGVGVGASLMTAVETWAATVGVSVLVLDTESGSLGERLYERLGWVEYGRLPDHAARPDGVLAATTFYYKKISPTPVS